MYGVYVTCVLTLRIFYPVHGAQTVCLQTEFNPPSRKVRGPVLIQCVVPKKLDLKKAHPTSLCMRSSFFVPFCTEA